MPRLTLSVAPKLAAQINFPTFSQLWLKFRSAVLAHLNFERPLALLIWRHLKE